MNEVKKCSLSGVAFTMDADAFEALENYLDTLRASYGESPDGPEIVADIEARIAELILSTQNYDRVVEKPLVLNIIRQMGSAEDISAESTAENSSETDSAGSASDPSAARRRGAAGSNATEPRIPRRLYRDKENARLGGVCAGLGRYFDIDPVWVRMGMFMPLLLSSLGWLPLMGWMGPLMGNLFGIFVICYLIMWFATPVARTARQKLEMTGERITAYSIGEVTAAGNDVDMQARPIVAETVSLFGKIVMMLLKLFGGVIVFMLLLLACSLIIGLIALLVGGSEVLGNSDLADFSLWVPTLGIFAVLFPTMLFIYVFMCLIASRKPSGRTVLVIFLLWACSVCLLVGVSIHEEVLPKYREKRYSIQRALDTEVEINGRMMRLEELLQEYDESRIGEGRSSLHISVPSESVDFVVSKEDGEVRMEGGGTRVILRSERTDGAGAPADSLRSE